MCVEWELEELRRKKAEIEQRIRKLTTLTTIHENVKLDIIKSKGPQCGKWTVYYKYKHYRWHRETRSNEPSEKWNQLFCCNTRKEAFEKLGEMIGEFQELYNELSAEYESKMEE